jgi:hypothetical protein
LPLNHHEHFCLFPGSSQAFTDDHCGRPEFVKQCEEFCRCWNLHRIYPGSKTSHTPIEHAIRAFERDEAEALRMHIEGEYPLLIAPISHVVEAFWFATTGRSW